MIDLGPHATFIMSAYGFVALVVWGLIAVTYSDAKRQQARLQHQEHMRSETEEPRSKIVE